MANKRSWLWGVIVLLLTGGLGIYWVYNFFAQHSRGVHEHQTYVLTKINYPDLEDAAKQIWSRSPAKIKGSEEISPDDPSLPPAIAKLSPHFIEIWPDGVLIELGGNECHYGFEAIWPTVLTDKIHVIRAEEYPSTRLTPHLTYYAENGVSKSATP